MDTFLKLIVAGTFVGAGIVWLMAVLFIPTAYFAMPRKGISRHACWLFLIPYVGIIAAYWVACAKDKEQ